MKYDLKFKLEWVRKYKEGKRDFVPSGICKPTFFKPRWIKGERL